MFIETDQPTVMTTVDNCSRCRYSFPWVLLSAEVLPNMKIAVLCPSCRMSRGGTHGR